MSKLILPKGMKTKEKEKAEENKGPALERVPKATGWRIVVLPYRGIEKTKGGIVLTDKAVEEQQLTTNVGLILSMGYAGSRVKIEGGEIRILNDDEVLAKLKDPKDVLTLY